MNDHPSTNELFQRTESTNQFYYIPSPLTPFPIGYNGFEFYSNISAEEAANLNQSPKEEEPTRASFSAEISSKVGRPLPFPPIITSQFQSAPIANLRNTSIPSPSKESEIKMKYHRKRESHKAVEKRRSMP